jgi:hypothetical protein
LENGQEIGQAESLPNEIAAPVEQPKEKLYTVQEVNNLIAYKKAEVAEKLKKQYEGQQGAQSTPTLDAEAIAAAAAQKTLEHLQAKAMEEEQRLFAEEHAKNQAELKKKLVAGRSKYDDFDEHVSTFNGASYPQVVAAAAKLDTAADIIYELSKNPEKAARLQLLADKNDYGALERGIKKLSDSIVQNEEAKKQAKPAAPYTKMKPGVASASSGELTIDDYAKMFKH